MELTHKLYVPSLEQIVCTKLRANKCNPEISIRILLTHAS